MYKLGASVLFNKKKSACSYFLGSPACPIDPRGTSICYNCQQVDIIGQSNVPTEGPIIFTGNHANQFVDALQVSSPKLTLNGVL